MKVKKDVVSVVVGIVVVILLVGLLLWQRREPPFDEEAYLLSQQDATPVQARRLVDRTEDEVARVVFQNRDEIVTMVPFFDDFYMIQWKMEGVDYNLNNHYARNKVRAAFSIFSMQVVYEDVNEIDGLNLDDFDLNYLVMTAYYHDGTTLTLYLGSPISDFRGRFLMVEGDPALYVISTINADRLLFNVGDMIDQSLPTWSVENIDHFFVSERDGDIVEFSRRDHDEFDDLTYLVMVEPFPGAEVWGMSFSIHILEPFSSFRLDELVSMSPDSLASYGLDNPSIEFIYRSHNDEAHLLFGDIFFIDEDGEETAFIYVKFADRPHVFRALFEPVRALLNINPLRFIERFIALVDILSVENIYVTTTDQEFVISVNHIEDSTNIDPTINGIPVSDSAFRTAYRLLIGLGIDYEIEPFEPSDPPLYTILYSRIDEDDIEIRLYAYDSNFHAVSVNNEEIWFVVSRRNMDLFMIHMRDLL